MVGGLIKKCIKKTARNDFLFIFIVRRKFFLTPYLSDWKNSYAEIWHFYVAESSKIFTKNPKYVILEILN